jgi:hypothetical protein
MKLLKSLGHISILASLCGLLACTQGAPEANSPEAALHSYVKIAFNAKSLDDAHKLLDLSTGEAKEWLASMTEETFKKQFLDNKMVLENLTTKDLRQEKDGDVSLVYEIAFKDGNPDGKPTGPSEFTNKKIAYLTKEGNIWKIRATKNVKTFIERKDALEIPPNVPAEPEHVETKPKSK